MPSPPASINADLEAASAAVLQIIRSDPKGLQHFCARSVLQMLCTTHALSAASACFIVAKRTQEAVQTAACNVARVVGGRSPGLAAKTADDVLFSALKSMVDAGDVAGSLLSIAYLSITSGKH